MEYGHMSASIPKASFVLLSAPRERGFLCFQWWFKPHENRPHPKFKGVKAPPPHLPTFPPPHLPTFMKTIRILIADDHAVVRRGLRSILQIEKDFQVAGEAADGAETVAIALRKNLLKF